MKKLNLTIGSDVCAYGRIEVDVPDNATQEQLISAIRAAKKSADDDGSLQYEQDWSTQSTFRVVTCDDAEVNMLVEGLSLDDEEPISHATQCTYLHGSVVSQQPVLGLSLAKLTPEIEQIYGGQYLIAAGVTLEVARVIANGLGLELQAGNQAVQPA